MKLGFNNLFAETESSTSSEGDIIERMRNRILANLLEYLPLHIRTDDHTVGISITFF